MANALQTYLHGMASGRLGEALDAGARMAFGRKDRERQAARDKIIDEQNRRRLEIEEKYRPITAGASMMSAIASAQRAAELAKKGKYERGGGALNDFTEEQIIKKLSPEAAKAYRSGALSLEDAAKQTRALQYDAQGNQIRAQERSAIRQQQSAHDLRMKEIQERDRLRGERISAKQKKELTAAQKMLNRTQQKVIDEMIATYSDPVQSELVTPEYVASKLLQLRDTGINPVYMMPPGWLSLPADQYMDKENMVLELIDQMEQRSGGVKGRMAGEQAPVQPSQAGQAAGPASSMRR